MARYCFYCGRNLNPGEKCHCQSRINAAAKTYNSNVSAASADDTFSYNTKTINSEAKTAKTPFVDTASAEDERSIRREAKRRAKTARKNARQSEREKRRRNRKAAYNHNYTQQDYTTRNFNRPLSSGFFASLIQLLYNPDDVIRQEVNPHWSLTHTLWSLCVVILTGLHYANFNLFLSRQLNHKEPSIWSGRFFLFAASGFILGAFCLLIYALTLWLMARYLYRQRALPFTHTLAAGRHAWILGSLILLIALPASTAGGIYSIVLTALGLAFAALIHAKSLGSLTQMSENQVISMTLFSIFIFGSLLSLITPLLYMLFF